MDPKKIACPRCSGKGSGPWAPANGTCYRCKGSGRVAYRAPRVRKKTAAQLRIEAETPAERFERMTGLLGLPDALIWAESHESDDAFAAGIREAAARARG